MQMYRVVPITKREYQEQCEISFSGTVFISLFQRINDSMAQKCLPIYRIISKHMKFDIEISILLLEDTYHAKGYFLGLGTQSTNYQYWNIDLDICKQGQKWDLK